jgi:osmoprotectant transport system ATP-binding protein
MFVLSGVRKVYATTTALDGVNLVVQPERTTVLIGPSGCGKSTLIRLMAGLITPDEGKIVFENTALSRGNIVLLRRRMGYVIQEGGLFPHMTARRNVVLMARYLGWERQRIEERLRELADLTQLPAATLDQLPIELSGGQRQRISLMRALMLDPDVLLLDEPLGALDSLIRYDLQQELRRIFQRLRKTVVLVTHDLAEASYLGDVLVLMRSGRIIQQGAPAALVEHPADPFVERFIRAQRGPGAGGGSA